MIGRWRGWSTVVVGWALYLFIIAVLLTTSVVSTVKIRVKESQTAHRSADRVPANEVDRSSASLPSKSESKSPFASSDRWTVHGLTFSPSWAVNQSYIAQGATADSHRNPSSNRGLDVFIHVVLGVFHRKRDNSTWGYGEDILFELLGLIETSLLVHHVDRVHITLLGSPLDRQKALDRLESVRTRFSGQYGCLVYPMLVGDRIQLSELPTIYAMQLYAQSIPVDSIGHRKILYIHSKGVRHNGIGDHPNEWRRYMGYFLLEKHHVCMHVLEKLGYYTCGVLKQNRIYAGNFWYSTAQYLASKKTQISSIEWNMANRYEAEEFILGKTSKNEYESKHYCIHHTHHDMQNCETPRAWYENVSVAIRADPNCYDRKLLPKTQLIPGNKYSWCHEKGLPLISA